MRAKGSVFGASRACRSAEDRLQQHVRTSRRHTCAQKSLCLTLRIGSRSAEDRQQRKAQMLQSHRDDTRVRRRVCVWHFARMQERIGPAAAQCADASTHRDFTRARKARRRVCVWPMVGSMHPPGYPISGSVQCEYEAHSAFRTLLRSPWPPAQTGLCLADGWLVAPPRLPHIRVRPVRK